MARIRVIHYGIDHAGAEAVRLIAERPDMDSVAAIDSLHSGVDLGRAAGLGRDLGIPVSYDAAQTLAETRADVVLHSSDLGIPFGYPQIMAALHAGKRVISNCPDLAAPWFRFPEIARGLDCTAKERGVLALSAGTQCLAIDALPMLLAAACQHIASVRISCVADISSASLIHRLRAGIGLNPEGFRQATERHGVGVAGLREAASHLAQTIGWRLDGVVETIEPITGRRRMLTQYYAVDKGYVCGLRQVVVGSVRDREVLRIERCLALGVTNPRDEITISGRPPISITVPLGLHGDVARAATMVNCIPVLVASQTKGLISLRDMPIALYHCAKSASDSAALQ